MLFSERSDLTISGSIRFRDFCAFLIHRGGIFARNLTNPRTAEPELDKKSLASLGIAVCLLIPTCFAVSARRFAYARPPGSATKNPTVSFNTVSGLPKEIS
jgi:hypothetical protein